MTEPGPVRIGPHVSRPGKDRVSMKVDPPSETSAFSAWRKMREGNLQGRGDGISHHDTEWGVQGGADSVEGPEPEVDEQIGPMFQRALTELQHGFKRASVEVRRTIQGLQGKVHLMQGKGLEHHIVHGFDQGAIGGQDDLQIGLVAQCENLWKMRVHERFSQNVQADLFCQGGDVRKGTFNTFQAHGYRWPGRARAEIAAQVAAVRDLQVDALERRRRSVRGHGATSW